MLETSTIIIQRTTEVNPCFEFIPIFLVLLGGGIILIILGWFLGSEVKHGANPGA